MIDNVIPSDVHITPANHLPDSSVTSDIY